jgi:2-polyprenyl-6-methoxyphenol hydroxylase-like FAD-dependent oxidoreductase
MDMTVIGAGIGGLSLGLALRRTGIPCHIHEAAPAVAPIGVGINVLPHATRELAEFNLEGMWRSGLLHTSSIRGCPAAEAGRHRLADPRAGLLTGLLE